MRIALVCSAHGFGHLTRQLELARHLRSMGASPVVYAAAAPALVEEWLPGAESVQVTVDVGIIQSDSVTEDPPATRAMLEQICSDEAIDRLSQLLVDAEIDLVVADTPPSALEAARRIGIPAVAVGNFSWPWIYAHYPELRTWGQRLAAWQAHHPAAELWPGPGLRGFAHTTRFGLVGRKSPEHETPRWGPGHVLVSFGGFGLDDLSARLPSIEGVTWVTAPPLAPLLRADSLHAEHIPYPALVAACELVVTKPGYGIFAETARAGTKLVWVPRGRFPEARHITDAFTRRGDRRVNLPIGASPAQWRTALREAVTARLRDRPTAPSEDDDAARLARWIIQQGAQRARRG